MAETTTRYEPIPDLAEQINTEERAKYIKGMLKL